MNMPADDDIKLLTPEQRNGVIQHLREWNRIKAIAAIRERTGVDLRRAIEIVRIIETEAGIQYIRLDENDMSMRAAIFGIGPFNRAILEHLPYGEEQYAKTHDGVKIVVANIFECLTSDQSRLLAK